MTIKLRGNGEKDNHTTSCCSHLPTTSKVARTQAAGNSCHPIKLNNLQVLGGSTCEQLAKQIHLLRDAGLLQFGSALPSGRLPSSSRPGAGVPMPSELGKPCSTPGSCKGFCRCREGIMGFSHSAAALCPWRGSVQSCDENHHPCSWASSLLPLWPSTPMPSILVSFSNSLLSPCFYYLAKMLINSNKRCLAKTQLQ